MPSDEIIETMAEGLWQGEWARGGSGGKRRVPWSEIAPVDQERWRFLVIAALSAAEAAGWVMVPVALVEHAFRDGLAYGNNVEDADPDLAWQQSRVRAMIEAIP